MSREINFITFIVTIIQTTFELPRFFLPAYEKILGVF